MCHGNLGYSQRSEFPHGVCPLLCSESICQDSPPHFPLPPFPLSFVNKNLPFYMLSSCMALGLEYNNVEGIQKMANTISVQSEEDLSAYILQKVASLCCSSQGLKQAFKNRLLNPSRFRKPWLATFRVTVFVWKSLLLPASIRSLYLFAFHLCVSSELVFIAHCQLHKNSGFLSQAPQHNSGQKVNWGDAGWKCVIRAWQVSSFEGEVGTLQG